MRNVHRQQRQIEAIEEFARKGLSRSLDPAVGLYGNDWGTPQSTPQLAPVLDTLLSSIDTMLKEDSSSTIVEIGCGGGRWTQHISSALRRAVVTLPAARPKLIVFDGTPRAFELTVNWLELLGLPAPDEMRICHDGHFVISTPVGLVFSFDVFVHFDFPLMRSYFQSVAKALRNGGTFLVSLASDFTPPPSGWVRSDEWFNYAVHTTGQEATRSIILDDEIRGLVDKYFVYNLRRCHLVPHGFGQVLLHLVKK